MKQLAIYGAGGIGREVAWLAESSKETSSPYQVVAFIDDVIDENKRFINDIPVMYLSEAQSRLPDARLICSVGSPKSRQTMTNKASAAGFAFATLIHHRVERSRWIEIGTGTVICAGSVLTTNIGIGDHVQINLNCTVGHDVQMGDFVTLAPGVHISGWVFLRPRVYVGTGAVIINGTKDHPLVIEEDVVIGAGACVTKSISAGTTVVGVPAKPLKHALDKLHVLSIVLCFLNSTRPIFPAMPSRHRLPLLLAVLIGILMLGLMAVSVMDVWRLNKVAIELGSGQVQAGIEPDWWLNPSSERSCIPPDQDDEGELRADSAPIQRLQAIRSLTCGNAERADILLSSAVQNLKGDRTVPLLQQAVAILETGGEASPSLANVTGWNVVLDQARSAYDDGNVDQAMAYLDTLHSELQEPAGVDKKDLYFWSCFMLRGGRRFEASLDACDKLVAVDARNPEAWNHLGANYFTIGEYGLAEKAFRQAESLNNQEAWVAPRVFLGRTLYAQQRWDEALDIYRQVLEIDLQQPWPHFHIGVSALEAGDCDRAATHFEQAVIYGSPDMQRRATELRDRALDLCESKDD